ncbi:zinc knuckle family protein [Perilla frutescens var. frutescens]|nr:zinc knuckle family protein [Perilla frutescens var. frutescens]
MKLKCDYCGRTGHIKKDCFEVIGVSDWYKRFKEEKGKTKANLATEKGVTGKGGSACDSQETNPLLTSDFGKAIQTEIAKHFATYLYNKGQQDVAAGMSGTQIANLAETDHIENMAYTGQYAFGLGTEIHHDEWIMDSGASNHMCCKANLLTNIRKLRNPIRIFLPDVSSLWALLAGDAQITPTIKLLGRASNATPSSPFHSFDDFSFQPTGIVAPEYNSQSVNDFILHDSTKSDQLDGSIPHTSTTSDQLYPGDSGTSYDSSDTIPALRLLLLLVILLPPSLL